MLQKSILKNIFDQKRYFMKSRTLKTIHNLIVSNYKISPIGNGKFCHTFNPETTSTRYSFEANGTPELEEGQSYNIGYHEDECGNKVVELSAVSRIEEVNQQFSYHYSRHIAETNKKINKEKNDTRVTHTATNGYYWGKKYAWRQFGLAIPESAFHLYLDHIHHPKVPCKTINPDLAFTKNEDSIAYKEDGLEEAIEKLIFSAEKVGKAYFKSPHYFDNNKKFSIYDPKSITDKK